MISKSVALTKCKNKRIRNSINNVKIRWAGSIHKHNIFHYGSGVGLREVWADKCVLGGWSDTVGIFFWNWILHDIAIFRFVNHRLKRVSDRKSTYDAKQCKNFRKMILYLGANHSSSAAHSDPCLPRVCKAGTKNPCTKNVHMYLLVAI